MPDTLEELRALEREVEREWWWLHGALNAVAQMRAERAAGGLRAFGRCRSRRAKWTGAAWRSRCGLRSCREIEERSSGSSKRCACNECRPWCPSTPYHF